MPSAMLSTAMNVLRSGSPEVRPPNLARLAFSVSHAPACLTGFLEVSEHRARQMIVEIDVHRFVSHTGSFSF
jgi:hypothetical protein